MNKEKNNDYTVNDDEIEWQDVVPQAEEKNNDHIVNVDEIEWQDVNIPSYTTLDVDTNEVYSVPATMDEVDARFAIDTQTKGNDKADYFGKNKIVDQNWLDDVVRAGKAVADATEETLNSTTRGVLAVGQNISDTLLHTAYHVPEKTKMLQEAERGDFSRWGESLSEEDKAKILDDRRKKIEWIQNVRQKNNAFWEKGKEVVRPEDKIDNLDRFMEGIGNGVPSAALSIGATLLTKNPYVGAAMVSALYGRMGYTKAFDKAIEQDWKYDDANNYATLAGVVEAGIEMAFEPMLLKVGKIGRFNKIGDSVVMQAADKILGKSAGRAAVNKMATKNTDSIWGAVVKGFVIEGGEEGSQELASMMMDNYVGLEDYSSDEILNNTLFSIAVGGAVGAGATTVGVSSFNRDVRAQNGQIKENLNKQYPELNDEELQVVADGVQDMLYQNANQYTDELDNLLAKENDVDALPEGIDATSITDNTRRILKEKYQMSDEEIKKTIDTVLPIVDARNQYNDVYQGFYEQLVDQDMNSFKADASAKILAARATSIAFAEKSKAADIVERWNLKFDIQKGAPTEARVRSEDIDALRKGVASKEEGLSLSQFVAKKLGGVSDDRGDIKAMGSVPGLLNKHGVSLDEATFQAWEAGYIQSAERPEVNDLLDLLSEDLSGNKIYGDDFVADDNKAYYDNLSQELDQAGVDINKDGLPLINKKMNDYYNKLRQTEADAQKETLNDDEQERLALMLDGGMTESEAVRQIIDKRANVQDDDLYFQADISQNKSGVEIAINSSEEMQGLSEDDFKNKMIDTLKSFKGQKIYNSSLNAGIEIRASSIKKYKSFFADKNKGLIVPYIPELLSKAKFNKIEKSYNLEKERGIKAYHKADLPIDIDDSQYNTHITVKEDDKGNLFWDAQIKEEAPQTVSDTNPSVEGLEPQRATPTTNPGDTRLKVDKSTYENSISLEARKVNNTLYQGRKDKAPRGYYQRKDSGEAIIKLFQTADASTIIHESAHFFLDDMQRFADNPTTMEQLNAIYNYVGAKDGNMTVDQHEYFARSFEAYLLDGRSPNNLLKRAFARFRGWLRSIYGEVKNLGVNLTPEIVKTFDDMLGGKRIDFAMQQSGAKMSEALESGTISTQSVNKAIDLLRQGKMSKADMEELISRLKSGELKRADFAKELKKFGNSDNTNNEIKNNYDYLKYRGQLERGNFSKKDVKGKIEKLLEWTKPQTNGGKLVGRFPDIVINREFDNIRKIFELDRQSALQKMNENADIIEKIVKGELSGDPASLVWENKLLSVVTNRASAKMLIEVYNAISDSYNSGRLTTAVTGEVKRARRDRLIKDAVEVLSSGKGENWRQESSKIKKTMRTIGSSMQGWGGILDMLSMFDGASKTGQSKISKNLNVFGEEIKMREGVAADGERLSVLLEKSLKGNGISINRYINEQLPKKYVIEWGINKRTFTKDKLIDIYMKAKDLETREMMLNDEINQFDEAFLAKADELLSNDDLAVASAFFNFYDETYQKLNDFYEEHYGVSLGKRQYYSPRSMDKGGIDVTTGDLRSYAGLSATKVRTAKSGPVDIKGAFYVLQNYIANSNHYIAFADKLQDINAVLGDVEIRNIIRSLFGEDLNKKIAREVSRFATNDKVFALGKMAGWASTIRSNYAVSVLALKPSLTIKQLTSFPAYWENMTTSEFLSGLVDFAKHPKQCMEILANTTYMKTRGTNIIKDFEIMSNKEAFKNLGNKIGFREFLMKNIQIGDRGAIYLGGWGVYKNVLEKTGSKKMAEAEFARITNETQQSSYMSEQNTWQSNPFGAAFTMFQTSQNQYFRKELSAIRGLITGRMPKSQVAKAIFIYHFLLPMFFQAVADGFRWDDKAQFRAAVLGSLNGVFVLGEVLERAVDWAMTGALKTRTAVRDLVPYWASGEDLLAEIAKIDIDDISVEDFIESLKRLGKPTGELLGLPIKYGIDIASNLSEYIDDEDYSKAFLLTLGWSPYALRDLD